MKFFNSIYKNKSSAPGTVTYIGDEKAHKINIKIFSFDKNSIKETNMENAENLEKIIKKKNFTHWINVNGVHDVELIEKIGKIFGIHPLTMEDIANTTQRPKYEEYENYFYYSLKMIYNRQESENIETEQVSFILTKKAVISFQEKSGDVFDSVRYRLDSKLSRIRNMGSDYLFYSLIDAVIDNYFVVLENTGEKIENTEASLINKPDSEIMHQIHKLRRETLTLRKALIPLRDINSALYMLESPYLSKSTLPFLKDLYDHTIQVTDMLYIYRDMVSNLMELYLSISGNRLNEIMKVLTIFASIFIPLTFIAGWYGMNFKYMPELNSPYAYPVIIIITAASFIGMLIYFKKKKWIGRKKKKK